MDRWQKIVIACLSLAALVLGSYSIGYSVAGGDAAGALPLLGSSADNPGGLALVEDTFDKIRSMSVDPPSERELARGAIQGMAEVLKKSGDQYAQFYTPQAYRSFQELTTGRFSGIGVWLKERGKQLEIVSVIPSTPAQRAGLRRGDVIETIGGTSVSDVSTDEAVARIKGPEGTDVTLGILRGDETLPFTITRATIELPNELSRIVSGDIGYIRLFGFARGAGAQVRRRVRLLMDDGAKGIILDLRDNGGGLFSEGVSVASVFIEDGEIVSYLERSEPKVTYEAEGDAFEDVPLVVLVNEGTASASEIVTGALKDRDRAVVVGMPTYGKGSVQEVLPLSDASALKLTIGAYFTPSGKQINGAGIEPDIEVDAAPRMQKQRAIEILNGIILSQDGSQG